MGLACSLAQDVNGLIWRVQGDHSGCYPGLVDIKTKGELQYMLLILKRSFCFVVNKHLGNNLNDLPARGVGAVSFIASNQGNSSPRCDIMLDRAQVGSPHVHGL